MLLFCVYLISSLSQQLAKYADYEAPCYIHNAEWPKRFVDLKHSVVLLGKFTYKLVGLHNGWVRFPALPDFLRSNKTGDRLCGLVVRVPGYRSRGPGSILGTTRFSEK
jgi:hypothetical protein